jgi:hypothetical protein
LIPAPRAESTQLPPGASFYRLVEKPFGNRKGPEIRRISGPFLLPGDGKRFEIFRTQELKVRRLVAAKQCVTKWHIYFEKKKPM